MTKIKSLEVNLPMDEEFYEVGKVPCAITQKGKYQEDLIITEIKDCSVEYEDSIHTFYEVYANGKLYRRIEYSPVTIEFEV